MGIRMASDFRIILFNFMPSVYVKVMTLDAKMNEL